MKPILPPSPVLAVLERLRRAGFEAWAVGGCIRDSLLGREPHDWDVTTSALPRQTEEVFAGGHIIETGLAHGTVTLLTDAGPVEITTFRRDGVYSDGRRPDSVTFTPSLEEDLARRDFTVNAMAWNPWQGLRDPFDGQRDLEHRLIQCVGDPRARFTEDALRVVRAIRFSAQLGFKIHIATALQVHQCAGRLSLVAPERFRPELAALVCGRNAPEVLLEYGDVIAAMLPELAPMLNHPQYNIHHIYDIWQHSVVALSHVEPVPRLRLAALLHDSGKPACFTRDEKGVGHFYGHAEVSLRITRKVLLRMAFPSELRQSVCDLVQYHDANLPADRTRLRRWAARLGPQGLLDLITIKRADNKAQNPKYDYSLQYDELESICRAILRDGDCYSMEQLAVRGGDLAALGLSGPDIGLVLQRLLTDVMDDRLPNDREALLRSAASRAEKLLTSRQ